MEKTQEGKQAVDLEFKSKNSKRKQGPLENVIEKEIIPLKAEEGESGNAGPGSADVLSSDPSWGTSTITPHSGKEWLLQAGKPWVNFV